MVTYEKKNEIIEFDLKQVIEKLRNRISQGEDQIINKLLKYDEQTRAIMSIFFKKDDKEGFNNCRGINLLNTALKLTTRIIRKINQIITLEKE